MIAASLLGRLVLIALLLVQSLQLQPTTAPLPLCTTPLLSPAPSPYGGRLLVRVTRFAAVYLLAI